METPSENVKILLEADTDLVHEETLFIGREPTSPNNTVTLFDTPDSGPMALFNKSERYDYNAVQARVRNTSLQAAMNRAKELVDVLDRTANKAVGNDRVSVLALDSPSLLDWDENNRARVVVNFQVHQTPVET